MAYKMNGKALMGSSMKGCIRDNATSIQRPSGRMPTIFVGQVAKEIQKFYERKIENASTTELQNNPRGFNKN